MKSNHTESNKTAFTATATQKLLGSCLTGCRKLITQLEKAKDSILAEFRETREAHNRLIRLAIVEAEALAWQTEYPHLVFPTLAREKAEAVADWETRQLAIQPGYRPSKFAA